MRICASRSRSASDGGQVARDLRRERDAPGVRPRLDDRQHRVDHRVERDGLERQLHLVELDVRQVGEVVEQAAEALGVAERDLEEAPRVLALLQRAAEQRLEVTLDGGERRAQLVGHVRHELRPHLLEPAQRGDVVEHEHDADAGLVAGQHERHRVHLDACAAPARAAAPRDGRRRRPPLTRLPRRIACRSPLRMTSMKGLPFAAGGQAEDRARALVHREDAVVPVDRDDALHHGVEDRGGLRALLLEVGDLVDEARRHRVERAAERADLVGRSDGHAAIEAALRHLAARSPPSPRSDA